ncbi:MAG: nuclear transport factor 2 family protein [Gemmatimonadota bacterium]|nr:nuclear transport factor 2 family protein [Gemmatimonadota bacterium]
MTRLLIAIIILVTASSPVAAQCSDAEKTKLQELDRAWGDASTRGDRAYLQTLFADDYVAATLTSTIGKAAAIDDALRTAERNKANPQSAPKLSYDNYIITCTPNTATLTHRNVATTTEDGREQTTYSRSVHILEKRGGRWQVVGNAGHALNDAAMLLYMENDWNEASKKRDAAWYERHYADDATDIVSRTGAIQSKAEAIASLKSDKTVVESLELSETSVRVEGNTAVVTGVNHVKGRDEQGRPFDRRVRFTDTFIKRDGRWQVWATQGTVIP